MDFIGTIVFFHFWDEAFCFSKICFQKKQHFLCFFGPYYHFSAFFWVKKDAPWNSASIGPNESPWTPIFDHFVQFLIISVPKQPGLKLKSVKIEMLVARKIEKSRCWPKHDICSRLVRSFCTSRFSGNMFKNAVFDVNLWWENVETNQKS